MRNIKENDVVVLTKDVKTKSTPSLFVPKGTKGTILELVKNAKGETEYLVELDNDAFPSTEIGFFSEDEIELTEEK